MKYLIFCSITLILSFPLFGRNGGPCTKKISTEQNTSADSLILKLFIDVAPNAFPKKLVAHITPIVDLARFPTFGIQGIKAKGNAQPIAPIGGQMKSFSALYYPGGLDLSIDLSTVKIQAEVIIYDGAKELERKTIEIGSGGQASGYYYKDYPQPIFTISFIELVVS